MGRQKSKRPTKDEWSNRDDFEEDEDDEEDDDDDDGEPISPVTPTVVDELNRLDGPKGTFRQALVMLAISCILFMGAEMSLSGSLTFIVHIVIILAIHEAGHWVAMRLFGYHDLRVFFIPFLGAAVSGMNVKATGVQRAIVSLAGPVPGIILAFGVAITGALANWDVGVEFWEQMVLINALNLLPFEPLDGGRFMNVVAYHRHPKVESLMRVVATVVILAAAVASKDWFLGAFGAAFAFGLGRAARISKAATALRTELTAEDRNSASIPVERREQVGWLATGQVLSGVDVYSQPKMLAAAMSDLWARALVSAPSRAASAILLVCYLSLLGGLAWLYLTPEPVMTEPAPELSETHRFDERGLAFEYPGNWSLETNEVNESEGGRLHVVGVVAEASAGVSVHVYRPAIDAPTNDYIASFLAVAYPELDQSWTDIVDMDGTTVTDLDDELMGRPCDGYRIELLLDDPGKKEPYVVEIRRAQRSPAATLFVISMVHERHRDVADLGFELVRSTMRLAP